LATTAGVVGDGGARGDAWAAGEGCAGDTKWVPVRWRRVDKNNWGVSDARVHEKEEFPGLDVPLNVNLMLSVFFLAHYLLSCIFFFLSGSEFLLVVPDNSDEWPRTGDGRRD
jgi:hypothetical protein